MVHCEPSNAELRQVIAEMVESGQIHVRKGFTQQEWVTEIMVSSDCRGLKDRAKAIWQERQSPRIKADQERAAKEAVENTVALHQQRQQDAKESVNDLRARQQQLQEQARRRSGRR